MSKIRLCTVAATLVLAVASCASIPPDEPVVHALPETVTFAGEPVPIDDPDVYRRVSTWYNFYRSQPWRVSRWLERAALVFPVVEPILETHGIPDDLKYVAVLESGLDPRAIGVDGERGIWQFMPDTADEYGLTRNRFIDERSDVALATEAAAEYFRDAYEEFDESWSLATASFNVGFDGVAQRITRQKERDYWSMVFPPVTEDYLPQAVAAKLLMEDAEGLGIEPEASYPDLRAFPVNLEDKPLYLSDIAEYVGLSFRSIWIANPHIWVPYLEPGDYTIYLPENEAADLDSGELEAFLRDKPYERGSVSADGDKTIAEIAEVLELSAHEFATFNDAAATDTPDEGTELVYWR